MKLQLKRVWEARTEGDGARVLVDRLWPRGRSKEKLRLDAWLKDIAPSDALRQWFDHDPAKWNGFRTRYAKELDANPEAVGALRQLLRAHKTVTLLFAARDIAHNNAVALREYLMHARASARNMAPAKRLRDSGERAKR